LLLPVAPCVTCVSDQFITATIPGVFSTRDQFFPFGMEPDDTRAFIVIEMAGDRIVHHGPRFLKRICLSKNGVPE
jgi:hypothetical protein